MYSQGLQLSIPLKNKKSFEIVQYLFSVFVYQMLSLSLIVINLFQLCFEATALTGFFSHFDLSLQ